VRDERGNRLVFRYYDPRVLRVYLPTCTASELRRVFGPIECFWMESGDPEELFKFDYRAMELKEKYLLCERTTEETNSASDATC
jgi:hypothetical protein